MSQLSEIRTNVQGNWPSGYHSSVLTDSKTNEFINNVLRWVCRGTIITPGQRVVNHNFDWMKRETTSSTVDGQQRYSLPTASSTIWRYKEEVSCELINANSVRVPLTRALKRDIEITRTFLDTSDTGTPSMYCVDQGDIWLYPAPDHSSNSGSAWTINLEYYGYPPDLSADGDTNEVTNFYPLVLEYGATAQGFRYGQDYPQADYWDALKENIFLEMLREDQAEVFANLDRGIQPVEGSSMSDGDPGYSTVYRNSTPYS